MTQKSKFSIFILSINFFLFLYCFFNKISINLGDYLLFSLKSPIINSIKFAKNFEKNFKFYFTNIDKLKKKLSKLEQENEYLKTELFLYKNAYNPEDIQSINLISANVIAQCFGESDDCVFIDKGKDFGIKEGSGVISKNGIVGIIVRTAYNFSKVMLLTSQNFSIGVIVKNSNAKGILSGIGNNLCKLKYIPLTSNVKKDMIVVTSGLGGIFPPGLLVGKILNIENKNLYKICTVKPFINKYNLSKVFILR